ncbi:acyl carrier protein [Actinoplanes sp. NPDC049548]|uniref:acyl carrier protein n=1 Tax=Actinoplanes sp. NPDC049548 TaxID=3155152 RepID=UPI003440D959
MSGTAHDTLVTKLIEYTRTELLQGADGDDLTVDTPLLEWGVLDSLKTARLVTYIRQEFGVRVPPREMTGGNFRSLASIAALVESLQLQNA